MECYVFNDELMAKEALEFIHSSPIFPVIGKNQKTGSFQPDKKKTEKWAVVLKRKDGRFWFPRLPLQWITKYAQGEAEFFRSNFQYTIETFEKSWTEREVI